MEEVTKKVVNSYPLIWPKLYAYLRFCILPIIDIERYVPKNGKLLDVGCGYGVTTSYFALKSSDRQVIGSELVEDRVKVAKLTFKNIKNIKFEVKNLIEDEDEKFDTIIAIDLLHHISDRDKDFFIKECKERLFNNGVLIIKDIDKTPFRKYVWNYLHDKIMTRFGKLYFYSSVQMRDLLNKNGFTIVQQETLKSAFYPHIIFVCTAMTNTYKPVKN